MLSVIVTILFAISTVALVVLVYSTVTTKKRQGGNSAETVER